MEEFQKQFVQWFPGHMAKGIKNIQKDLKKADAVIEVLDARAPVATSNPEMKKLIQNKTWISVLNKSDLADNSVTDKWVKFLEKENHFVIPLNLKNKKDGEKLISLIKSLAKKRQESKSYNTRLALMVLGIPNTGKSTLINRLANKNSLKTENRPGVTRQNILRTLPFGVDLIDTPGILSPKLDSEETGEKLAFLGSVSTTVYDIENIAYKLVDFLQKYYPNAISQKYEIETSKSDSYQVLIDIAEKRAMKLKGNEYDTLRASEMLLSDFRNGKLGKISLERPDEF
ncbi:MAG: ribosome biogenesis GTPase YlqF [Clostridia bacterium]|nr:ribosome biogenesis GTPase YlqF [Clostridia bacterium]